MPDEQENIPVKCSSPDAKSEKCMENICVGNCNYPKDDDTKEWKRIRQGWREDE